MSTFERHLYMYFSLIAVALVCILLSCFILHVLFDPYIMAMCVCGFSVTDSIVVLCNCPNQTPNPFEKEEINGQNTKTFCVYAIHFL